MPWIDWKTESERVSESHERRDDEAAGRDPLAASVETNLRDGTFLRELADRLAGVVRDVRLAGERRNPDGACVIEHVAGEAAGWACRSCGHATVLHPGPLNVGLEACLVCLVDGLRRSMAATLRERVGGGVASDGCAEAPGEPSIDEVLARLASEIATLSNPWVGHAPGLHLAVRLIEDLRAERAAGSHR